MPPHGGGLNRRERTRPNREPRSATQLHDAEIHRLETRPRATPGDALTVVRARARTRRSTACQRSSFKSRCPWAIEVYASGYVTTVDDAHNEKVHHPTGLRDVVGSDAQREEVHTGELLRRSVRLVDFEGAVPHEAFDDLSPWSFGPAVCTHEHARVQHDAEHGLLGPSGAGLQSASSVPQRCASRATVIA